MAFIGYDELLVMIDVIARYFHDTGEYVAVDMDDGRSGDFPMRITHFTKPDAFALVRFARPQNPAQWTRIEIAGGGGVRARPEPGLFQHLLARSATFDWGGPFATRMDDGTVTYGSRLRLPSSLANKEDPLDARDFVL